MLFTFCHNPQPARNRKKVRKKSKKGLTLLEITPILVNALETEAVTPTETEPPEPRQIHKLEKPKLTVKG
ncbi:UNVERIFIED_CONTAM: hypothetical protein BEN50_07500 [Euhalothece sp. KZN 001]